MYLSARIPAQPGVELECKTVSNVLQYVDIVFIGICIALT